MTRALRTMLIVALALCAACKTGKATPTAAAPSEAPSASPASQTTDFQLVGTAEHAFLGVGPGIDTSGTATETSPSPSATQSSSTTFANPTDRGVMRVRLDDASDALKSGCGAARDETAIVFWTTDTQFDTSLLASNLESSLEGRTVGVVGRFFTSSQTTDQVGAAPPSPTGSPAPTISSQCVLVADQVGTSSGTLPTARPTIRTRRTATPTAVATPSPSAKATAVPTASRAPSASPTATPTTT